MPDVLLNFVVCVCVFVRECEPDPFDLAIAMIVQLGDFT